MTIVAVTGQRKYTGWETVRAFEDAFSWIEPDRVYIGMAPGADLMAGEAAMRVGIPHVAVVPWAGHRDSIISAATGLTDIKDKDIVTLDLYDALIQYSIQTIILDTDKEYPGPWVYHNRNRFMVDEADVVFAYWDGTEKGGTYQTILYANSKDVPVEVIGP